MNRLAIRSTILFSPRFAAALAAALTACGLAALAANPAWGAERRDIEQTYDAKELTLLRVEIPVVEVRFTGGSSREVEVAIDARCRRSSNDCERALEDLHLEERRRGDRLTLELDGYPKWGKGRLEIEATIAVPATVDLDLDVGVGEVEVEGMLGDIDVELGVGELEIFTGTEHLRSIDLDVGVGEAEIYGNARHVEGRRSFLVGSEVYWSEGEGEKRITADVGVGEATVRVD